MRAFFLLCFICGARLLAAQQDYYIKFPDDIRWTDCPGLPTNFGSPELFNTNGANLEVSYEDATFTVVPDACYKIERVWLIKSNPYDSAKGCIYVYNPQPSPISADSSNLPGPIVSPSGTAAPWAPTVVKILPTDPAPTNFSIFWADTANCYQYKQVIRVIDTDRPTIVNCPFSPQQFQDMTPNDPDLWNELYWLNIETNNADLNEAPVPLTITATDNCSESNVSIRYILFLDLDKDGLMETVISSTNPPAAGQVNYFNIVNPNFSGGTPRIFDKRPVPANEKYRFGLQESVSGAEKTGTVAWHTEASPGVWTLSEIPPGTHKIKWFIEDNCGNEQVCEYSFTIAPNPANFHTLLVKASVDTNANCQVEAGEAGMSGWRAKLAFLDTAGSTRYEKFASANANGYFSIAIDSGTYRLTVLPPNDYWASCLTDTVFTINTIGDSSDIRFSMQAVVQCPFLETDIGVARLRRCFDNRYSVQYCNTGTVPAENAYLEITLDPYLSLVSSGIPGMDEGNNTWRFELGTLPVGFCGSFSLILHLDCDSTVLGQTHCVEAHIYPDSLCMPPVAWSGANVEVDGQCQVDSVHFVIRNTGTAASSMLDYIVIEDNIINYQNSFQLPAGDSLHFGVPANGSTWRVEAEQEPGNPGNPMPSASVEGCGENALGEFSVGFISQFDEGDEDPFISIDCQQSRGAFDPNDKTGYPLGYGDKHLIAPGQPIEYLIRFQNTGTDTAFRVVLRDTLAPWLDPGSVVSGASSHSYRFELTDTGVVSFIFDNIRLPDSMINEAASHGFVKFRVNQRGNIPLGTVVSNTAAIYFDFNTPVWTNITEHQVGEHFIPTGVRDWHSKKRFRYLSVSPNPLPAGNRLLRLDQLLLTDGRFDLYDGRGQFVQSCPVMGNQVDLHSVRIPEGLYYFKVFERGRQYGAGKVVLR